LIAFTNLVVTLVSKYIFTQSFRVFFRKFRSSDWEAR